MKVFILSFTLLALFQPNNISAQKSENIEPFSSAYKLQPITEFEEMPKFSTALLLKEDKEGRAQHLKINRFAQMIPVGFHPFNSGTWDETGAGKVWRLGIHSKDAYSLYLVFNEFKLVPGVKIFVYNSGITSIAGAFTSSNNNRFNKLTIAPIAGDSLIIELDIPSGIGDFGKLTLGKVGHDYKNEFGANKLKASKMDPSLPCEVDINCPIGDLWQIEKRAVCRLIVNGNYCTGTLINNAENLKIPYLITAQHCVSNEHIAEEGVFYFNYERPSCGKADIISEQTLSGAELMATTDNLLDFALLKLNEYPPLDFQPFFAGWDARPDIPQSGVCIHHPEGDVKKISVDNIPLVTDDAGERYDFMSYWKVTRWDVGLTEGGSSGASIFNDQHRLFGTLTSGTTGCSEPNSDYFTKFSLAWDKYPDSANQVKYWLNPKKKGALFCNGVDPYNSSNGHCNTFWNVSKNEFITLSNSNLKWGWLSGHNSAKFTKLAEKFINQSTIQIQGAFLYVAKAYNSTPFSTITVKIWEGNSYPTTEIYSKQLYMSKFNEKTINFVSLDSIVLAAGNFFIGYEINYSSPSDTFAVYQSASRGVNGPSTMYVYNNDNWQSIDAVTSPPLYTSLSIGLIGCEGSIIVPESTKIMVDPNPFYEDARVDLPEGVTITKVLVYNTVGRAIPIEYQISDNKLFLFAGKIPSGIYILELRTKSEPLYGKFMIIKN